jgi:hypothetical protein
MDASLQRASSRNSRLRKTVFPTQVKRPTGREPKVKVRTSSTGPPLLP